MAVEGGGVELGEDVHLVDPAVDAFAHGHVDEPVRAAYRHLRRVAGRLGPALGEREEPGPSAAAEDDRHHRPRVPRLHILVRRGGGLCGRDGHAHQGVSLAVALERPDARASEE